MNPNALLFQDAALAREEARDRSMRNEREKRRVRFLNEKERTIGIDKDYLDQQVKEKNEQQLREKEEEAREGAIQTNFSLV